MQLTLGHQQVVLKSYIVAKNFFRMSSNSAKLVKKGVDLISQLPDSVIGQILGSLPLADAVRTSILSRQWRNKYLLVSRIGYHSRGSTRGSIEKVLSGILGILQAHNGSLVKFLLVPELESCITIDRILELVAKKGVKSIFFTAPEGRPHTLDSSFFSNANLEHLKIKDCVFQPPPSFRAFRNLVSIFLNRVNIADEVLSPLVSRSPLLECLSLIISNDHLGATAPNLKVFRCRAQFKTLSLAAPRLVYLSITLPFRTKPRQELLSMFQIQSTDSVEHLHMDCYYMMALHRYGTRFEFKHLRVLRLSEICFGISSEVNCMLQLIKSCPNLEKLIIEAVQGISGEQDDVRFSEILDLSCSRISQVQMLDYGRSNNEFELVKLMLLKLPELKLMVIAPADIWILDASIYYINEFLSEFPLMSPQAQVYFSPSDDCKESLRRQEMEEIKRYTKH